MGISAFFITLSEAERIGHALDSVLWTDEQIVVDGGSIDETVAICKSKGAKVLQRKFDNFADQKNFALSLTKHDWALSIDADERVTPDLRQEILNVISNPDSHCDAYYLRRQNYFLGKPLKHGRQGNDRVLRLFKKERGRFDGMIHEVVKVFGKVGELESTLTHEGTRSIKQYFEKLDFYTDLEAKRMKFENKTPNFFKALFYPPALWFLDYVVYGGFLDGWHGFLYHSLSCYYGWLKNLKARALR